MTPYNQCCLWIAYAKGTATVAFEMWWERIIRLWWKKLTFFLKKKRTTRTTGVRLPKRTGIFTSLIKHTNFEKYLWALGETADGKPLKPSPRIGLASKEHERRHTKTKVEGSGRQRFQFRWNYRQSCLRKRALLAEKQSPAALWTLSPSTDMAARHSHDATPISSTAHAQTDLPSTAHAQTVCLLRGCLGQSTMLVLVIFEMLSVAFYPSLGRCVGFYHCLCLCFEMWQTGLQWEAFHTGFPSHPDLWPA